MCNKNVATSDKSAELLKEPSKTENPAGLHKRYNPPPVVSQTTILLIGFAIFGLAMIWPPLILFVTYAASVLIPYCFRVNDDACMRRQLFAEFQKDESLPIDFLQTPKDIEMEESYWVNKRGMCLCTATMAPKDIPIKAVVCFSHGFTDHSSFMKRVEHQRLVRRGIAVVYIEIEGHGRSDGDMCLISDWDVMTDDVADFFQHVRKTKFKGKPFFLMGESMGGAISYTVYNKIPEVFKGVIFQAPMVKISDETLPPKFLINLLEKLLNPRSITSGLGYLPLAPADNKLHEYLGTNKESLEIVDRCPTLFSRNPRLKTAQTLLDVTKNISQTLSQFNAPFLVQHGSADRITDPKLSQALYDESKSTDKTIKIYDGKSNRSGCLAFAFFSTFLCTNYF